MDIECLRAYYKSQEQKIRKNYSLAIQFFEAEGIHDLRVEIKRLRAFIYLTGAVNPIFHPQQNIKKIQKLFKAAGKLRDIHVQQDLARRWISQLDLELSEYYNFLKNKELVLRKEFFNSSKNFDLDIFKTIWGRMKKSFMYIPPEYIQLKAEERFEGLIDDLIHFKNKMNFVDNDYHAIRIHSKETRYTLEILQECMARKISMKRLNNSLRGLHQSLGKWHDDDVGLQFLTTFRQEYGEQQLFNEDSYSTYSENLQREKKSLLKLFERRWNSFLKVVKVEKERRALLKGKL